jgi:cell division protein FtsL
MLDEAVKQLFDGWVVEAFGPNYRKMRETLNELNRAKDQQLQRIDESGKKIESLFENISSIDKKNENYIRTISAGVGNVSKDIISVKTQNNEHSRKIDKLEKTINDICETVNNEYSQKIKELERKIADLEAKTKTLSLSRNNECEPKRIYPSPAQPVQPDSNIIRFNGWAANPTIPLPAAFTFLAGEPRIRTSQQLMETAEETKWIKNLTGVKKYLFPNPNSFNPNTDIHLLYDMDQNMLKEKGKNKIKIITPCEISSSGWIEFPGELKILP